MKPLLITTLVFVSVALICRADPPPDALVKKLTAVIREHCPDAIIEMKDDNFTAKHGTMIFTLHPHQMTGEILPKTYQEEGPNVKGFLLTVKMHKGKEIAQLVTPQEIRGPYFPTFINDPPTSDGKNQYWISFSYGTRFDTKLKRAIFDALPKGKFQPDAPSSTPDAVR